MGGYKAMLRDRMPFVIDLALRWCKAKTAYIDYLYDNYISKVPQERRSNLVKELLGIKRAYYKDDIIGTFRLFGMKQVKDIPNDMLYLSFGDTIDWAKLALGDPDVFKYWRLVDSWVKWFKENYLYIENTYKISMLNNDEEVVKETIMIRYCLSEQLTDYLIKSFKENE